ncbi:MAG: ParB/RepB/Spo0J family partition protein [Oscillospiraceae bacterium]|nr:ParB/RepB/Spo0J family partition protein [Oscillospiraceae bacterium]MBR2929021.1 ParB/RepB/Spo0J family partition protein [Oscillospiraceae bacterium]MBR6678343.1 ParB/RepB/Spo0J family partition protein [Oscillospiraceae bacterium]
MNWTFRSRSSPLLQLSPAEIRPNPDQPRVSFDDAPLQSLAESIRQHGILQPLTVRKTAAGYVLVAGERRLRAAKLAGCKTVPCLLMEMEDRQSALLALVENLQREDLHYLEEAAAIAKLMADYGLSQEEAAKKLGRSQSAVANKLRLLRLSPDCTALLRKHALTERHARALLRLEDEEERLGALRHIAEKQLNVAQSEEYIEQRLQHLALTEPKRRPAFLIRDVRLFLNSLDRSLRLIRDAGIGADCQRQDTEGEILLTIRIDKKQGKVSL